MPITEQQRIKRQKYLGSSDTPVILGLSPYSKKTPTDIYFSKIADLPDESSPDYMQTGNYLEDSMLRWAQDKLGVSIIRNQFRVASEGLGQGLFASNSDALIKDKPEGIEAKYVGQQFADKWGEEGTNEVPLDVIAQVQHQMYSAGTKKTYVVAGIAGFSFSFKLYVVERNENFINLIVDKGVKWWTDFVIPQTPPDPNAVTPIEILKAIQREEGSTIELDEEAEELVNAWEDVKNWCKDWNERRKEYDSKVIKLLGDNEIGLLPSGRKITYKRQNSSPSCDYVRFRAEAPELAAKCITQGTHPVLRITKLKEQ